MRVVFLSAGAVAFNEWGECAKIEGRLFQRLLKQIAERKKNTTRSEKTIIRDVVEGWPDGVLKWVPVSEANQ